MTYTPSAVHIERYANLLVNFALGAEEGISPGDTVAIMCPENAKPLYVELCRAVWRAGGNVIGNYEPADEPGVAMRQIFYELASDAQLEFCATRYYQGLIDEGDHFVYVTSETDPHALSSVDPAKMMRRQGAMMPLVQMQNEKEARGELTWTIALYATDAMAAEAQLSIEEYWGEVIAACFLDDEDPIARWREVEDQLTHFKDGLNALPIDRLHVEGGDADLWLTLGERRLWVAGSGRNIPSFEVFTSPDCRRTEGWIRFSEPLYTHGSLITGIELEFRNGRVVRASAEENEELLKQMLAVENADQVGEFSLTDARLSPIRHFMANTLYDENTGGEFGNTHIAIGRSIRDTYDGDQTTVSEEEWEELGYSMVPIHTDIVSTTDRTVTAVMHDGTERVIYAGGRFQLD